MAKTIGIDTGTQTTRVAVRGRGIVLRQPSVVAVSESAGEIIAVGDDAAKMYGKTDRDITVTRPLSDGVIVHCDEAQGMLEEFISASVDAFWGHPHVVASVPLGITEIERRALEKVLYEAGGKNVRLLESVILAALGASVPVMQPHGYMVVDIGAGTTEAALISMGRIVCAQSCRVGGEAINSALIAHVRKKFGLVIGSGTAEQIKCTVGTAYPGAQTGEMGVHGLNAASGRPDSVMVKSEDVFDGISDPILRIVECVRGVLQNAPPEMAADLCDDGITLTGGGALLCGMEQLLSRVTKTDVHTAQNPADAVALGLNRVLRRTGDLDRIFSLWEEE